MIDVNVGQFIKCVRDRPQLWNQMDPMYRNPEAKNKLWEQISQEMNCSASTEELKQKWHNLRDVFRREEKRLTQNTSKKKRRWYYYCDMLFLSTQKNHVAESTPKNFEIIHTEDTIKIENEIEYSEPSESAVVNDSDNIDQGMMNCTTCSDANINCSSFTDNDDYHFAMSIVPHMRQVPMHRKLKMRIKISEIIAQEMK